ncbi:unnamed protein product [Ixodes pacificus]
MPDGGKWRRQMQCRWQEKFGVSKFAAAEVQHVGNIWTGITVSCWDTGSAVVVVTPIMWQAPDILLRPNLAHRHSSNDDWCCPHGQ